MTLDNLETAVSVAVPMEESEPMPAVKSLFDLVRPEKDDPNELLKHRFLCCGGGMLLVGPTGIGKSSYAMQAMILWALGLDCFGVTPARPLKSLLVQAENDEVDLVEMREGVINGLGLTNDVKAELRGNVMIVEESDHVGSVFLAQVGRLLEAQRPDLLWIDPALAYLGGNASSQEHVGVFLRNYLTPMLKKFGCGCVIVHHTNKPAREKGARWAGSDHAYQGTGSIEWAGWARAILVVESLGTHSVFQIRAAKRGSRLRWKEADGVTTAYTKLIKHDPKVICWRAADAHDVKRETKTKPLPTRDDLLILVPTDAPISKDELRKAAQGGGIAVNRINPLIDELVAEGKLFQWHIKRPGTNPMKLLARYPQPDFEVHRDTHTETRTG